MLELKGTLKVISSKEGKHMEAHLAHFRNHQPITEFSSPAEQSFAN